MSVIYSPKTKMLNNNNSYLNKISLNSKNYQYAVLPIVVILSDSKTKNPQPRRHERRHHERSCYVFSTRSNFASFLHFMVLLFKLLLNHSSKRQLLVLFYYAIMVLQNISFISKYLKNN